MKLNKLYESIIALIFIAIVFYLLLEEPFRYARILVYLINSVFLLIYIFLEKIQITIFNILIKLFYETI